MLNGDVGVAESVFSVCPFATFYPLSYLSEWLTFLSWPFSLFVGAAAVDDVVAVVAF
jgi:hypothetical protein